MDNLDVVGKSLPRVDALDKATGQAVYAADVDLPGMLHARIKRSPLPHARILNINTSRAAKLPGVRAVLTGREVNLPRFGRVIKDKQVLATDKVRYVGDPVAAVCATDLDTVEEALDLIEVEYEELPAVFDPISAIGPDAPIIHEELESYEAIYPYARKGNICSHMQVVRGDVELGFKESDYIFENEFKTPLIHQAYLEPHCSVAQVDRSGKITVWTSTQAPFNLRDELAAFLGIPLVKIRVIVGAVGGAFGGKHGASIEPVCILLSRLCSKPVKMALDRDEEFTATTPRHSINIKFKTGVKKDGALLAHQADIIFDTGAYAESGPWVMSRPTYLSTGPYRVPNVRVEGRVVYTNRVASGSMRGVGVPQTTFAIESHMDMMAKELSISPLEMRLKNALVEGDLSSIGQRLEGVTLKKCISEAIREGGYRRKRGMGMACAQYPCSGAPSSAAITVNHDGSMVLSAGIADLGTGSRTLLLQIAAQETGIPFEKAAIISGDTELTPYDSGSGASRVTYITGMAVKIAAQDVKEQLLTAAADMLEANREDLVATDGMISVKGSPNKKVTIARAAFFAQNRRGGPIIGRGSYREDEPAYDQSCTIGFRADSLPCITFSCHIAEVEVDEETGKVRVVSYTAAHDVGKAINPAGLEGQIEGAISQGLGFALSEELLIRDGTVLNGSFRNYLIPRASEAVPVKTVFVEEPGSTGPYGAKGVGEQASVPSMAAIANAIYDAVGVRIKELPITPDKILTALQGEKPSRG